MPPLDGRLIQLWLYGRNHPDDNHYSHPIDVVVLVDLNLKKVGPHLLLPCFMTDISSMHELFSVHDVSQRQQLSVSGREIILHQESHVSAAVGFCVVQHESCHVGDCISQGLKS